MFASNSPDLQLSASMHRVLQAAWEPCARGQKYRSDQRNMWLILGGPSRTFLYSCIAMVCFQMDQTCFKPFSSENMWKLSLPMWNSSDYTVAVVWESTKPGSIIFSSLLQLAYICRNWITYSLSRSPTGILLYGTSDFLGYTGLNLAELLPSFRPFLS